jgi:acyl carrier protein
VKDPTYLSVRNALADYLEVAANQIRPDQDLEQDWGIDRTERSVLALRLEEREDLEIPSAELEQVQTVGQLVALVRAIRRHDELAQEITSVRTRRGLKRTDSMHRQLARRG